MPKRASVPEGKALFFRPPEPSAPAPMEQAPAAPEQAPVGAPEPVRGSTRQSAIFLEEQHIDWLEDRCREARRNGGRAIRKAAIIRALLDVAMEAGIDLTCLRREEDIAVRIRRALRS
jgi:hypothetical protein